ncbi:hypothetical protein D0U91_23005 [Salmonella enterica]|uniref:Uncharacterized protein n=1 Tax=Salmonella enterica TaxID=28901 RepID=A0A5U1KP47_SALER|nr:hypothetical protein [Salmonella enterica]
MLEPFPAVGAILIYRKMTAKSRYLRKRSKSIVFFLLANDCFDVNYHMDFVYDDQHFFEENEKYFSTAIDGRKVIDYLINT